MDCKVCNLKFNSKDDLFKHFRTPEHDANIEEDSDSDEEDTPSDILLKEQCEFVDELDRHYTNFNSGTSIEGYPKINRMITNIKKAKKLRDTLVIRYMDDFNIERDHNTICRCGKKFETTENLIKHQIHCEYIKNTNCNICGKTFSDAYVLKTHRQKCIPAKDKEFKCEYCPKSYDNKCSLQRHLKICKKKPPKEIIDKEFKCLYCPKSYADNSSLKRHNLKCKPII